MEPVNYSAHAIEGLKQFADDLSSWAPASYQALHNVIGMLQDGVKFLLPNKCELLDPTELGQTHLDLIKLPFPCTIFEAPWHGEGDIISVGDVKQVPATKRIALCWESTSDYEPLPRLDKIHKSFPKGGIFVYSIFWVPSFNRWVPSVGGCFVPYDNKVIKLDLENALPASRIANEAVIKSGLAQEKGAKQYRSEPFFLLPEVFERSVQAYGSSDRAFADILMETRDETMMLIQACSVLNCANIETGEIEAPIALNKKRVAKGLQPFFSYKVLQLSEKRFGGDDSNFGGTHAAPRMHLRRGHLRRLETRTIWIRPAMVNANSAIGIVEKDYKLRRKTD